MSVASRLHDMEWHPEQQDELEKRPSAQPADESIAQVLPSMLDLDHLAADLDAIDSTLAELDAR